MQPARGHIRLIHLASARAGHCASREDTVRLPRTAELERFLHAIAARGLHMADALRLAIERALVLIDADTLLFDRGAGAAAAERDRHSR
jgi:hypothetical protein